MTPIPTPAFPPVQPPPPAERPTAPLHPIKLFLAGTQEWRH